MRAFALLDSGPLGQACRRTGITAADQCRNWIDGLVARAVEVVVPEIADYEVRRELRRINAFGSLSRLDDLVRQGGLSYQPVSTAASRYAALFWANAVNAAYPLHRRTRWTLTSSWRPPPPRLAIHVASAVRYLVGGKVSPRSHSPWVTATRSWESIGKQLAAG
jgi:hypothetical protein